MDPTPQQSGDQAGDASGDDRAATIDRWLAREREVRLLLAQPGKIPLEEIAKTSGLEFLRRIGRGELPSAPIFQALDYVPVECEEGRMVFQGTPKADYYNPIGSVHGGYIATLLDSAVACAVQTMLRRGFGYTTLELKLNYVRPLTDRTGPVRAEGRVISVSRQIGTAEGRLVDAGGKLYAHATTTCLIFPLPQETIG
ncbi:PaaI family thioesterase [Burkholderiaceae bacterium FT117]|uniref:PaaI family thioesterase n=1 Tax=Zeimonas sediminis TaxID=2944268 RepID=UPI0023431DA1|nr:PaaI family thioesterase [Zeimonas sediminis]MCM5569841.1 PaaI family thioesterase [Zeimonas sediminis]